MTPEEAKLSDNQGTIAVLDWIVCLVCLIAPSAVLTPWSELRNFTDFPDYYVAGYMTATGQYSHIYEHAAVTQNALFCCKDVVDRALPTFSPPVISWIFAPLGWMPFYVAHTVWTVVQYAAISVAFIILMKMFEVPRRQKLWYAVLFGLCGPLVETIRIAQLGAFDFLGLILIACAIAKEKPMPLACSGILLFFKPHFLIPVLAFELGARRIKALALTALLIAGGLAIGCIIYGGVGIVTSYLHLVQAQGQSDSFIGISRQFEPTLQGQLIKFGLAREPAHTAAIAGYISAVLACIFWGAGTRYSARTSRVFLLCVIPLSCCFAIHLLDYDLLALMGTVVCLMRTEFAGVSKHIARATGIVLALFLFLPVYIYFHYFMVLRGSLINPVFIAVAACVIACQFLLPQLAARTDKPDGGLSVEA